MKHFNLEIKLNIFNVDEDFVNAYFEKCDANFDKTTKTNQIGN